MSFEHLILRYGLAAVFVGAAVEGDLTLILAGVAAHLDYLSFPTAVAASVRTTPGRAAVCCPFDTTATPLTNT